ncbi:MAG: metallophosphoesterase [Oscillospiraceae bacterium]|jgi:hypothetical protein|nr:metallophosphoesterase [Oscillospiraceae bacterium]
MENCFELPMQKKFRLAVFTDLHIDGLDLPGTWKAKQHLRQHVRALQPGLAVVLGDTALCWGNHLRTRGFVRMMDALATPWTAVLGNHEGESRLEVSRRNVLRAYQASRHFLGNCELPGVAGYGNQCIVLSHQSRPVQLLFFLDSGGKGGHDYVQPSQLDWMTRTAARYPGTPGMVFLHVPPWQFKAAQEALHTGTAQLLDGALRESVCTAGTQAQSDALVATCKTLGVWAIVAGHDHANDFDIAWQGMRYIYAQSGGYSRICYDARSQGVRGCTVFVFDNHGVVQIRRLREHANKGLCKVVQRPSL